MSGQPDGEGTMHALCIAYKFLHELGYHRTCQQLVIDSLPRTRNAAALPSASADATSLPPLLEDYARLKRIENARDGALKAHLPEAGPAIA